MELVHGWCAANLMKINISKTRVITAKRGLLQQNWGYYSKTGIITAKLGLLQQN
jgi:hypothetical protein